MYKKPINFGFKAILEQRSTSYMSCLLQCYALFMQSYTQIPSKGTFAPKMKKGVFGVGPKEIAYGYYDGDTVEVCAGKGLHSCYGLCTTCIVCIVAIGAL